MAYPRIYVRPRGQLAEVEILQPEAGSIKPDARADTHVVGGCGDRHVLLSPSNPTIWFRCSKTVPSGLNPMRETGEF